MLSDHDATSSALHSSSLGYSFFFFHLKLLVVWKWKMKYVLQVLFPIATYILSQKQNLSEVLYKKQNCNSDKYSQGERESACRS